MERVTHVSDTIMRDKAGETPTATLLLRCWEDSYRYYEDCIGNVTVLTVRQEQDADEPDVCDYVSDDWLSRMRRQRVH